MNFLEAARGPLGVNGEECARRTGARHARTRRGARQAGRRQLSRSVKAERPANERDEAAAAPIAARRHRRVGGPRSGAVAPPKDRHQITLSHSRYGVILRGFPLSARR